MDEPGPLLASGRDADIFDVGNGSVLRRARSGRPLHREARVMQLAHAAGYPVPEVHGISDDGVDLVMERVEGPTLLDDLASHPWRVHRFADLLAGLLLDLHAIEVTTSADAPDDAVPAASTGAGSSLIHLDLHPLNVLMSPKGPVVIDWANAGAGVAEMDMAVTWVVMAGASVPGGRVTALVGSALRDRYLRRLLRSFDLEVIRRCLPDAAAWKMADANIDDAERAHMQRLVDRQTTT